MALNLISLFMRWLRQILHIGSQKESPDGSLRERGRVEVTSSPEETSIGSLPPEKKPADICESEKKTIQSPHHEKKTAQEEGEDSGGSGEKSKGTLPSEEESGDIFRPKERPIESTEDEKKVVREKGDGTEPRKPYAKKAPTEERKKEATRPVDSKRKPPVPEKRESIFLGDLQMRKRRLSEERGKSRSGKDAEREATEKRPEEERISSVIESPFVEIDLDDAKVWLVLPQQELKSEVSAQSLLSYAVDLNGELCNIPAAIITGRDGRLFLQEKRILLEKPLVKFQVVFPSELRERKYNYSQTSREVYAFIAIGNNRGRFYYLNDKDGNVNVLPGREMWILTHEDFELQTEPEVVEEKWIWQEYQPLRVNLGEINGLFVKNRKSGEQKRFFSESTFCVQGKKSIRDDFEKECPLFTGKMLKIVAPHENPPGWNVWILQKHVGARILCKDWTGNDCVTLRVPEDLPCEFGEFQIDICQRNSRVPDETLFFRLMPPIELAYPKTLIIPDPKTGHGSSVVNIKIDSDDEWKLDPKEGKQLESSGGNSYQIEVPPENDAAKFSLAITGRPESSANLKITIPRLKWKTSNQKEWQNTLQRIDRKDLEPGKPLYFWVRTNDFENKYDILAVLETNGRKVQEGKFVRKGVEYCLELNEFFDTIKQNTRESKLRIEIRKAKESGLLGSVEAVHFEAETKITEKIPPKPKEEEPGKMISPTEALVRRPGRVSKRKGKGFSKEEIIGAGMNFRDVRLFAIHYDKRRKSSHSRNINALKILREKRIIGGGDEHAA